MKRLAILRKEKNLNQSELAKLLNISQQSISKYENAEREPDKKTLLILADFFNVSTDYLLGNSDIRNPYDNNNTDLGIYTRVKEIANNMSISIEELEKETNLRPGTIEEWKYRIPTGDKVQRVAIALGTTIEFLLIGENDNSSEQKVLARKLNKLTDEQLRVINSMIDALEEKNKD